MLYVLIGYVVVAAALCAGRAAALFAGRLVVSAAFLVFDVLGGERDPRLGLRRADQRRIVLHHRADPRADPRSRAVAGWTCNCWLGRRAGDGSKYMLALYGKHIFNPAAIAVVITAFALGEPASWWVGTGSMLPAVVIGGLLIVRKVRQEEMVGFFLAAALLTVVGVSCCKAFNLARELQQLVIWSRPALLRRDHAYRAAHLAADARLQALYAALTGFLFIPQIHVLQLYSTPELALVVGNVFSYLVSPEAARRPHSRKNTLAPDILDFVFAPSQRLPFFPASTSNARWSTRIPTAGAIAATSRWRPRPPRTRSTSACASIRAAAASSARWPPCPSRASVAAGQVAGDFTLPADRTQKLAFIAGGIGITPYRSMLKYLLDTKQRRDIALLYANRGRRDRLPRRAGRGAGGAGAAGRYTLTDPALPKDWPGYRADHRAHDRRGDPRLPRAHFYISGPPDMVPCTERVLRAWVSAGK